MTDRFEGYAERQIREAMERGEFDDLPGAGQPLPDLGDPYDPAWWVKRWVQREGISADELRRARRERRWPGT